MVNRFDTIFDYLVLYLMLHQWSIYNFQLHDTNDDNHMKFIGKILNGCPDVIRSTKTETPSRSYLVFFQIVQLNGCN